MDPAGAEAIRRTLPGGTRDRLEALELFAEIDSTNRHLLAARRPAGDRLRVAIAGRQSAGRGRHGRRWVSDPEAGLWMSVAASFAVLPQNPAAITLAAGAAVARALTGLGVAGIGLKWPNDLVVADAKLGGILVESTLTGGGATFVCGLGLNTRLPREALPGDGDFRPVALDSLLDAAPEPLQLAAPMIEALCEAFDAARANRLAGLLALWRDYDRLRGRAVTVADAGRTQSGIASGIADDGALLLQSGDALTRVVAGTLRLQVPVGKAG
ncbi:MAG: biotin--[acetyl-CoA-carboxylase] ligase [Gammaproteobacteria bacterium]|nr:biotin--[acetyl-CoA-carboxylase] ligase [Gammaproteobacteria bacterium]MDH4256528.1 biotin--[acetyl-CoA-carboxylase] ligase [Gammaproteobacteria bacterium]MDH5310273.1 biotin--[acetyl-CoA-carboxylase] ligase [Gammaproteobacteria bacterium]